MFGGNTGSLELTTDAAQVVHDWMIADGRNLTVTSAGIVSVEAAIGDGNRDLGAGSLTLTSTGGAVRILADISTGGDLTLSGVTGGINLRGGVAGARALAGAIIMLTGNTRGNQNLTITASGILGFNGGINTGTSALSLTGATIQIGRAASAPVNTTRILLRGGAITLTSADGIEIGRFSGSGSFFANGGVANLTVTATGALTIAGNITVASTAASGGDIGLTGGSIAFGDAARTITGRAITLSGAATGTADLTITASGTLTINNDIGIGTGALTLRGAGAISNGGNIGRNRLTLTAGTVSLEQDAAFVGARPFNFSTTTDLLITTDAAQDVHDWMIVANRNLTVTSALNVIVRSAIGAGLGVRDLGDGSLILRSAGGVVRIFADISTMGDLTLDASTLINLNGGARILNGAAMTLSGNARSNRALTLTATTFALGDAMSTINVVGANVLTIEAGSNLPASLTGNDRLTAGTLTLSFTCPSTTCVDITP